MEKWIEKMNEMFAVHPWTDANRVKVTYIKEDNAIVVRVLNDMRVVTVDNYSEYGVMVRIMQVMDELYSPTV